MVSIPTKIVVPVEEFKMRIITTRHVDSRQPLQILVSDKDRSTRTIFSMAMAQLLLFQKTEHSPPESVARFQLLFSLTASKDNAT